MREINNVRYYGILEIVKMFTSGETEETIRNHLKTGKLREKKLKMSGILLKNKLKIL